MIFKKLFGKTQNKGPRWEEIEYFNPQWKDRIKQMAAFIKPKQSVIDLGCGEMWLKEFLPGDNTYTGVDYKDRGEGCIVCDFNKKQFPENRADAIFISGCLEYVEDYKWFIKKIGEHANECILSYCVLETFPNVDSRKAHAWVNHLKEKEVISLFSSQGFKLLEKIDNSNRIFHFSKK